MDCHSLCLEIYTGKIIIYESLRRIIITEWTKNILLKCSQIIWTKENEEHVALKYLFIHIYLLIFFFWFSASHTYIFWIINHTIIFDSRFLSQKLRSKQINHVFFLLSSGFFFKDIPPIYTNAHRKKKLLFGLKVAPDFTENLSFSYLLI